MCESGKTGRQNMNIKQLVSTLGSQTTQTLQSATNVLSLEPTTATET